MSDNSKSIEAIRSRNLVHVIDFKHPAVAVTVGHKVKGHGRRARNSLNVVCALWVPV